MAVFPRFKTCPLPEISTFHSESNPTTIFASELSEGRSFIIVLIAALIPSRVFFIKIVSRGTTRASRSAYFSTGSTDLRRDGKHRSRNCLSAMLSVKNKYGELWPYRSSECWIRFKASSYWACDFVATKLQDLISPFSFVTVNKAVKTSSPFTFVICLTIYGGKKRIRQLNLSIGNNFYYTLWL